MSAIKNVDVNNRRSLLKSLVAGSTAVAGANALPASWSKPLTDSIILPSHGTTTIIYGDSYIRPGDYGQDNYSDYEIVKPGDYGNYDDSPVIDDYADMY